MLAVGIIMIVVGYALVYAGLSKLFIFPPNTGPVSVGEALGVDIPVKTSGG